MLKVLDHYPVSGYSKSTCMLQTHAFYAVIVQQEKE
jgi:hypothetical protein